MSFEKKVMRIRNSIEFTHGLRRALVSALGLIYFISLGFNVIAVTTLFAISTLMIVIFEFPTSAIADYDSRKKAAMISQFLFFIAFLGVFLFTNFWILSAFWLLHDIAWAFGSGTIGPWAIDSLNIAKKKSKLVRLISQGYIYEKSGWLIGGIIGFLIVSQNFRAIWLAISMVYLGIFLITGKYMIEKNFSPEKIPASYIRKSIIKLKESFTYIFHQDNRNLRALLIGGYASTFSISSLFVALPLFFVAVFGFGPEVIPGIYAISATFALIGPIMAQKLAVKKGFRNSLFLLFVILGLVIIGLTLIASIVVSIILLSILKILLAMTDVVEDSALHHEFSSKIRASLSSINGVGWALANSLAIFLTGISINFLGIANTMFISGGFSFVAAVVYSVGLRGLD